MYAQLIITNESGTDKSDITYYFHQHSMRDNDGLVNVNRYTIAENFLKS
jgi:DNA-binding NtrC family response regulator